MDGVALETGIAGRDVIEGAKGNENLGLKRIIEGAVSFICPDPSLVENGIDKLKEMAAAAPELAVQLWSAYRLADYALGLKTGPNRDESVMRWGVMRLSDLRLPWARMEREDQWGNRRYNLGENPILSGEMDYLLETSGKRLAEFREMLITKAREQYGKKMEVQATITKCATAAVELGLDPVIDKLSPLDLVYAYDLYRSRQVQEAKGNEAVPLSEPEKPFGMSDARRLQMEMVVERIIPRGNDSASSKSE